VTREDVAHMAQYTLAHRLIVSGIDAAQVVREAVADAGRLDPAA
jgi:hypothetical protein